MPYPVHLLDKMIRNGINMTSKVDFVKDDWHHRDLVQSEKRLTREELDEVIFGLEKLDLPPVFFKAEEGCLRSTNFTYDQFKIPIAYKNRWFTLSFAFYNAPQPHLGGSAVHYLIYQEFLPWDHAIYLTDDGKLEKVSGVNPV